MNNLSSEIIENNNSKTINRVSTKDEWELVNPVLQFGEIGFEIDGQMINQKMGNGVTSWNALPYIAKQCPYDVGDIYITENETHPSVRWPGTEWEALPGGHCLVAVGTNPETGTIFQAGETGGEEKHQLTIGELPSHNHAPIQPSGYTNHRFVTIANTGTSSTARRQVATSTTTGIYTMTFNQNADDYVGTNDMDDIDTTADTGKGTTHNNLQPWVSAYLWRRVL